MDDEQRARLKAAPHRPPNHTANFLVGAFGLVILYLNRGTMHTLSLLGWVAVVLAAALAIWVSWRGAGKYLDPGQVPAKRHQAALPLGLLAGIVITRYFGRALDSSAVTWPAGTFFACVGLGWFAHYAFHRLFPTDPSYGGK